MPLVFNLISEKQMQIIHEYLFDVTLLSSFRIKAENESEARRLLAEALDCVSINAGKINEDALIGEASMEGDADLAEVDGHPC
jgi:hypothetical protein